MDTNDSDNIFREKLGNFAAEPDPHVWDRIRHSLDKKQRKRLVPLWLPLGAAVAVVLLALWFTGPTADLAPGEFPVTDAETTPATPPSGEAPPPDAKPEAALPADAVTNLARTETDGSQTPSGASAKASIRKAGSGATADTQQGQARSKTGKSPDPGRDLQRKMNPDPALLAQPANAVAQSADDQPEKTAGITQGESTRGIPAQGANKAGNASETALSEVETKAGAENSGKKSLFDVLEEQEAQQAAAAEKGRWSMGPSVAPVYYNSFGNGSPIAPTFMENSKSGTVNLSYGLSVAYEVSDRLSLRSGIHKVDFGYNTNQVSFTSTVAVRPSSLIRTISYSENSKNVVVHSALDPVSPAQQEGAALDITAPSPQREGRMLQQFGYLEVPLELQYTLIDRQWGLNLIGGMSSLFLIDNSVSLDSDGTSTEIGEASNMNALNFSTNLGLGVYYQLNPKWQLQLQPMVKMHLNTFNETAGSFRPYTVGVYSGMSFRF